MRRLIIAAIAAIVMGAPTMAVAKTPSSSIIIEVDLVKEMTGAKSSVVLGWGSYSFYVNLRTNGSASRLTVTPTSITNGIAISLSDVKISFSAPAAYTVNGNTISRLHKTAETGDVVKITVSVWQPLGSPTVRLSYDYKAKDKDGVWR